MAPSVPAKPSCPRCHESWLLENSSKSKRRWQPSDLVSVDKISSDHKCVRCRQVQFLRSTSVSPNCRAQSHPLVWWVIAEVWQLVVCLISLSSLFTFPFGFRFYHYYVNSVQNCLASYKKWLKWLCITIVCRETIKDWSN
jgi:hypothetical protein